MNQHTNDNYNIRNNLLLEVAKDQKFRKFKNWTLEELLKKGIIEKV